MDKLIVQESTTVLPSGAVRSFVRRSGRLTKAQERALEELLPQYGLTPDHMLDLDTEFGRTAPRHMEIGFGMGGALLQMAETHPENDYLGIEVHYPGVGQLLDRMEKLELSNIRVINGDAVPVLENFLPPASLDAVYVYFPDPWPKKKHNKRRIVQVPFVQTLARLLKPGGKLHLATDWEAYAEHMLEVMESQRDLYQNLAEDGQFHPRPDERPLTKFEQRGQRLGHGIWDLLYQRLA